MSFNVPRFPSMQYHRNVIEHWTYRWDEDNQTYLRAMYRPLGVIEPMTNPRDTFGLPLDEDSSSTTESSTYSGATVHASGFIVPVLPSTVMSSTVATSSQGPVLRPPGPHVRSPVTIPPNTSLGQAYFTDGTVTFPTPGPSTSTGAPASPSVTTRKRSRNSNPEDSDHSPTSRPRWVSPPRGNTNLPDSPDSPDPSPPDSPRTSPTPIVFPDTPPPSPPLLPAANRPASPPLTAVRPAPKRPAPRRPPPPGSNTQSSTTPTEAGPSTEAGQSNRPSWIPDDISVTPIANAEAPTSPVRPAPDRPAPDAPRRIPRRVTIAFSSGNRTETISNRPMNAQHRDELIRSIRQINSSLDGSNDSSDSSPPRVLTHAEFRAQAQVLLTRLEQRLQQLGNNNLPQPFVHVHTRHPEDRAKHLTIVPSWGLRAKDKRGRCNICLEDNKHLQIKCAKCNNQCVCCKCIIGVYRFINPCPMCRHRGEQ